MTNEQEQQFIQRVNDKLCGPFSKDPEKNLWTLEKVMRGGNRVVVINGQRIDQPGEEIRQKITFEITGFGEMKTVGTDEVEVFAMIDISSQEEDNLPQEHPSECIFIDEVDKFLNDIFGL